MLKVKEYLISNKIYFLIGFFVSGILSVPFYIYLSKYGTLFIDSNPESLGQWGDFINPFVSLVNIFLLVYISFEVKKIEDRRQEQNIDVQRKITMTQMRNDVLKQLNNVFISHELTNDIFFSKIAQIESEFLSFYKHNEYLFVDLYKTVEFKSNVESLKKLIPDLRNSVIEWKTYKDIIEQENIEMKELVDRRKSIRIQDVSHEEEMKILNDQIETMKNRRPQFVKTLRESIDKVQQLNSEYYDRKDRFTKDINSFIISELEGRKNGK